MVCFRPMLMLFPRISMLRRKGTTLDLNHEDVAEYQVWQLLYWKNEMFSSMEPFKTHTKKKLSQSNCSETFFFFSFSSVLGIEGKVGRRKKETQFASLVLTSSLRRTRATYLLFFLPLFLNLPLLSSPWRVVVSLSVCLCLPCSLFFQDVLLVFKYYYYHYHYYHYYS